MENLPQYNEQRIHWQKSVSEVSKFIIDRLDKVDFYEYLNGENINAEKTKHWDGRLKELVDKAIGRQGYKIDRDQLLREAKKNILILKERGELVPSKNLDRFCGHIEEL